MTTAAFDEYEPEEVLTRRGSVSTVVCRDPSGERCVLKVFEEPSAADIERLRARAGALSELAHRGLARCLGLVESRDGTATAMVYEWVEGPTVAEEIEEGRRYNDDDLWDAMTQILAALEHAHTRDRPVVHRDVKPQNIVHAEHGYVLIDFGAAREIFDDAGNASVVGTTGYAAPEQFVGDAVPATDQYGLAATVLHMATHRHPGEFPLRKLRVDLGGTNLSTPLRRMLQRMLEPTPDDRFPSTNKAVEAAMTARGTEPWETALEPISRLDSIVDVKRNSDGLTVDIAPRTRVSSLIAGPVLVVLFLAFYVTLLFAPKGFLTAKAAEAAFFVSMFLLLMPAMYAVPQAWFEFRRTRRSRIHLDDEGWSIESVGPFHEKRLTGPRDEPPELKQVGVSQWERPVLQFGVSERSGLIVCAPDGTELTIGTSMLPVEAESVRQAVETFLRGDAASERHEERLLAEISFERDDSTALVPAGTQIETLRRPVYNPIRLLYAAMNVDHELDPTPGLEKTFERIPPEFTRKLERLGFEKLGYFQSSLLRLVGPKSIVWASPDRTILVEAHPGGMGEAEKGVTYHLISLTDDGYERFTWSHSSVSTRSHGMYVSHPTAGSFLGDLQSHREWLERQEDRGASPVVFQNLDDRTELAKYYHRQLASPRTMALFLSIPFTALLMLVTLVAALLA